MNDGGQLKQIQKKACIVCQKEFAGNIDKCPEDGVALTVLDSPRDPLVGTLFCDRFQITEVLGGGGMGMVYRAQHLMMQRSVAIKILHTKMAGNADALKRFSVEAKAASNFSHPNILNVHDFGVSSQGQPYMVMDFLDGINLTSLLDTEKRVAVGRALGIFLQVTSALAHAHSKEIIHRDVKPSNIMLVEFEGRKDFVKLVDFGIAKVLNPSIPEAENLTRTGEVFGSPLYMSPEQCKGQKLDVRADIYSLGAVMYRVVTGKPIFDSTDPLETMFRQVSEMPLGFAKVCPEGEIPQILEAVIFKCLAKERDDRYQSMNELREDLDSVAANFRSRQRSTSPINTLSLESDRVTAHSDVNGENWLNDLSENTGALPATPAFLNVSLDAVVNSEPHAQPSVQPQPVQPQPASAVSTSGSNSISFSTGSSALHQNAIPPQSSSPPRSAPSTEKREQTISIVIDKKSIAFGSVALAVLLAIAGVLYFRPSGPVASPAVSKETARFKPDSQNAAATTLIPHTNPALGDAIAPVVTAATPAAARAARKPSASRRKPPKPKPFVNPYYARNQGSYPTTIQRNYYNPSVNTPTRSYEYHPVQPVREPAPVVVTPPPAPVQQSQPERSGNRYAERYAEQGLSRASNSRPVSSLKRGAVRLLNKGLGFVERLGN